MKKLLLPFLLLVPLVSSQDRDSEKIYLIDYDTKTGVYVYCIDGHAFARFGNTALIPLQKTTGLDDVIPKTCVVYKN